MSYYKCGKCGFANSVRREHCIDCGSPMSDDSGQGSILDEAKQIVCGDREEAYGDPGVNVRNIAAFWAIIAGVPLTADQVCLMMIAMKVARLMHKPDHRDSLVDIPGYAALMERIQKHKGGET